MTENKRFTINPILNDIEDENTRTENSVAFYNCEDDNIQDLCDLLNELNDENERLKDSKNRLYNRHDRLSKDWDKLYDEILQRGLMTEEEILKVVGYEQ